MPALGTAGRRAKHIQRLYNRCQLRGQHLVGGHMDSLHKWYLECCETLPQSHANDRKGWRTCQAHVMLQPLANSTMIAWTVYYTFVSAMVANWLDCSWSSSCKWVWFIVLMSIGYNSRKCDGRFYSNLQAQCNTPTQKGTPAVITYFLLQILSFRVSKQRIQTSST